MAARDLKRYGVAVALAVGAFAWAATDTFAQQFVMDGLKTMYTLDEADIDGDTVLDVIGTNHATLMGAARYSSTGSSTNARSSTRRVDISRYPTLACGQR